MKSVAIAMVNGTRKNESQYPIISQGTIWDMRTYEACCKHSFGLLKQNYSYQDQSVGFVKNKSGIIPWGWY